MDLFDPVVNSVDLSRAVGEVDPILIQAMKGAVNDVVFT